MPVGLENLYIYDEEIVEQVQKTLNTGSNYLDKAVKWKRGEMEFEALMRMLDAQVMISFFANHPFLIIPSLNPNSASFANFLNPLTGFEKPFQQHGN